MTLTRPTIQAAVDALYARIYAHKDAPMVYRVELAEWRAALAELQSIQSSTKGVPTP